MVSCRGIGGSGDIGSRGVGRYRSEVKRGDELASEHGDNVGTGGKFCSRSRMVWGGFTRVAEDIKGEGSSVIAMYRSGVDEVHETVGTVDPIFIVVGRIWIIVWLVGSA